MVTHLMGRVRGMKTQVRQRWLIFKIVSLPSGMRGLWRPRRGINEVPTLRRWGIGFHIYAVRILYFTLLRGPTRGGHHIPGGRVF